MGVYGLHGVYGIGLGWRRPPTNQRAGDSDFHEFATSTFQHHKSTLAPVKTAPLGLCSIAILYRLFLAIASPAMRPLTASSASSLVRVCARQNLALPRTLAVAANSQQLRAKSTAETTTTSSFDSPFGSSKESPSSLKIPSFKKYVSPRGTSTNKVFSYFMAGSMGLITAVGAKATVQDFLVNMSASADVLAQAKVEIALNAIPEGKNVIIKWRGKPVFIRHRTASEIAEAENTSWEGLRDPQPDSDRVKKPEWLVMLGVCTHLGCVPIGESGDFGGWFCPCHGSHYDISGRIRKGPAPLNLEVPQYDFPSEDTLIIG
ncbi:ubiquinol--cytochrome-c reductase catalytic subunit rip1 [Ophidiomyces ophidiicola]|uniref:Ubiquinol--cytochrome-c reductase catalytic subunit rip1 n=1 Tax=Ophidiomyces ophidiicola TaxID=1387563 RepID=A0ACB8USB1_9EURO|nr:ubiquinol--cytochrome-c reductase catalytic subunit rip1 [Ophidiomyces ophidiicola]KAI1910336.1 ubiquinol--cytochrome-c reductase catalytic subunit rip1 [Ophidiomyces ophidiicola]KAI1937844.1 ubiquinol--cytochrome-c reductase catalytic subunit rip1 [Ophidiomyces ophidiicola]KAI1942378.1 ubiquinol--cytochrome-c reductase catalytic subunit rip1 [Ophidiomyces ophidiicola]KAI2036313.1 ubiquinol--cytochrome-c reductase catalytic subunit rip1 [Ophidiomyces ophidiicola]KAI2048054.1 ubiquinol--cyto